MKLIDAEALAYEREPVLTADVARRHVAGLKETVAG